MSYSIGVKVKTGLCTIIETSIFKKSLNITGVDHVK